MTGQDIRPGYKQTEVGMIPEDWEVKPLSAVCDFRSGYAFKSSTYVKNGLFKIVTIANVQDGVFEPENCNTIPSLPVDVQSHHVLSAGDILMSMTGNVGRVCLANSGGFLLNQRVGKVMPRRASSSAFLFQLLKQSKFKTDMELAATGGAQGNIGVSTIVSYRFALPPDEIEQRAIAAALGDADAMIAALEGMIAKKRDLKQAAMQHLLTGKTRLPGFSGEWDVKRLGDACWFQEGPGVRNTQFTTSGVKLLNGTNIYRGLLNLETTGRFISVDEAYGAYSHFMANEGDIVLASSGITIERLHEKVAFVRACNLPFCMNTSTIRFKVNSQDLSPDFLFHFLTSDEFKRPIGIQATGSAQLNFGPSHVAKVDIALPPVAEQTAIAEVLSDMDADLAALEAQAAKARAVKQGMMQELLTGRVRLV